MINEPIKIINFETLQQEKRRLEIFASYQEELLKNKITYIKQNTSQLIAEQFLPYELNENRKINNLMDSANQLFFEKYLGLDLTGKNKFSGLLIKLVEIFLVRLSNVWKH